MWSSRPYTFDRVVRIFFSLIVLCIVLYFCYILRHVLLPFCVACLIAYLIEPWVRWNQRILHIKKHVWGVVITTLEAVIVVAILCIILIPIIEKEFSQLVTLLDNYMTADHIHHNGLLAVINDFAHAHFDMDKIIDEIEKINIAQAAEGIWKSISGGLDKLLGILGWLISIIYVIFILLDFDKYKNGVKKYIPEKYKPIVGMVAHDTSWTMKEYFRNQAFISLIVGVLYAIGFSIVGIPMAVVIGIINIVLFMVPYLVYLSVIPVIFMCLFKSMETGMDFWVILLECGAVYLVVELFSDLILTPRIMGKALGLNPAIILLSLSIWGTLMGVLGMLIALPVTTVLLKWGKSWLATWRDRLNSSSPPPDETASSPEQSVVEIPEENSTT